MSHFPLAWFLERFGIIAVMVIVAMAIGGAFASSEAQRLLAED